MTADFAYDPVTAIDEAKATGETAALFAEIRRTMHIPLVTSIWRGQAGTADSLCLACVAAKPIWSPSQNGGDARRCSINHLSKALHPPPFAPVL
jgi:hypothetical protein